MMLRWIGGLAMAVLLWWLLGTAALSVVGVVTEAWRVW